MTEERDPFSDARSGFVRLDDMEGRLLLVVPLSVEQRDSTLPGQSGKKYDSITADVIVLDGDTTDMIEEIPFTIEGTFLSGQVLTAQLKAKVGKGMVLGRLGKQKARTKGFGDAWVLNAPTDADKKLARPAAKAYQEENDPFS